MKKTLLGLTVLCAIALMSVGCASPDLKGPKEAYKPLSAEDIPADEARMVIYRLKQDEKTDTPNIRLNGFLVGALHRGQYLESFMCVGENIVNIYNSDKTIDREIEVGVGPGEIKYLRLYSENESEFAIAEEASADAIKQLKKVKHTSYLVSRMAPQHCITEQEQEVVSKLEEVTLQTDALFKFDKAEFAGKESENKLLDLVDKVSQQKITLERVRIIGHTDRLGSKKYNQALSEKRASKVAAFLLENGLEQVFEASGKGSAEPVTTGCLGDVATPNLVDCLQADRRVTVELWGTRTIKVKSQED